MDGASVAASIVGLATAGVQISIRLVTLSNQISTASERISSIGNDVSLTSGVLQQLGELMTQKAARDGVSIFSQSGLETTMTSASMCERIFTEIEAKIKAASEQIRGSARLSGGKIKLSKSEKARWPFLQPSIDFLRSDLREAKETLMLMLQVTTLAFSKKMADSHQEATSTASSTMNEQRDIVYAILAIQQQMQQAQGKSKKSNSSGILSRQNSSITFVSSRSVSSSGDDTVYAPTPSETSNVTSISRRNLAPSQSRSLSKITSDSPQEAAGFSQGAGCGPPQDIGMTHGAKHFSMAALSLRSVSEPRNSPNISSITSPNPSSIGAQIEGNDPDLKSEAKLSLFVVRPSIQDFYDMIQLSWSVHNAKMSPPIIRDIVAQNTKAGMPSVLDILETLYAHEHKAIEAEIANAGPEMNLVSVKRTMTDMQHRSITFMGVPGLQFVIGKDPPQRPILGVGKEPSIASQNPSDPSLKPLGVKIEAASRSYSPSLRTMAWRSKKGLALSKPKQQDKEKDGSHRGGNLPDTKYSPSIEIFKSLDVSMEDLCSTVLPAAVKKYKITADWQQYSLYIVYEGEERCIGLEEKPLILFKQLDREGRNPMFVLRQKVSNAADSARGTSYEEDVLRVSNRADVKRRQPQCWDHGCNGEEFPTFSNLLRHQREKKGIVAKPCPICGAEFQRTAAHDGCKHLVPGEPTTAPRSEEIVEKKPISTPHVSQIERERAPYANTPLESAFDNKNPYTPPNQNQPIERERKLYLAVPGGGKKNDDEEEYLVREKSQHNNDYQELQDRGRSPPSPDPRDAGKKTSVVEPPKWKADGENAISDYYDRPADQSVDFFNDHTNLSRRAPAGIYGPRLRLERDSSRDRHRDSSESEPDDRRRRRHRRRQSGSESRSRMRKQWKREKRERRRYEEKQLLHDRYDETYPSQQWDARLIPQDDNESVPSDSTGLPVSEELRSRQTRSFDHQINSAELRLSEDMMLDERMEEEAEGDVIEGVEFKHYHPAQEAPAASPEEALEEITEGATEDAADKLHSEPHDLNEESEAHSDENIGSALLGDEAPAHPNADEEIRESDPLLFAGEDFRPLSSSTKQDPSGSEPKSLIGQRGLLRKSNAKRLMLGNLPKSAAPVQRGAVRQEVQQEDGREGEDETAEPGSQFRMSVEELLGKFTTLYQPPPPPTLPQPLREARAHLALPGGVL